MSFDPDTNSVLAWMQEELDGHADIKYSGDNKAMNVERVLAWTSDPSPEKQAAIDFILNYVKRAELFGLDTPQGRQALGKAGVTIVNYLTYLGEAGLAMPAPGVPSGEIKEWA